MSLKSLLSKVGSAVKTGVEKVTSGVKNVAKTVLETVATNSKAVVQTVQSVTSGDYAGAITGVATIGASMLGSAVVGAKADSLVTDAKNEVGGNTTIHKIADNTPNTISSTSSSKNSYNLVTWVISRFK